MGLSSNVLWHMTKKDAFFCILKSKQFRYSYSLEKAFPSKDMKGIAFPMISMSDLPFSEIATTKWTYGDYAIGLSREWGVKNGFSPVWYCNVGSRVWLQLSKMVYESATHDDKGYFGMGMYLMSNVKFVQAPLISPKRKFKNYRFYDEREYRLVPYITETDDEGIPPYILEEQYEEFKKANGSSMLGFGVSFEYSDIKYLIVNSESNIDEVKKILSKDGSFSNILIVTKKDVMEDFVGIEHNVEILPSPEQQDYEAAQRHLGKMRDIMFEMLNERKKK